MMAASRGNFNPDAIRRVRVVARLAIPIRPTPAVMPDDPTFGNPRLHLHILPIASWWRWGVDHGGRGIVPGGGRCNHYDWRGRAISRYSDIYAKIDPGISPGRRGSQAGDAGEKGDGNAFHGCGSLITIRSMRRSPLGVYSFFFAAGKLSHSRGSLGQFTKSNTAQTSLPLALGPPKTAGFPRWAAIGWSSRRLLPLNQRTLRRTRLFSARSVSISRR